MHTGYLSGGIRADLAGSPRLSLLRPRVLSVTLVRQAAFSVRQQGGMVWQSKFLKAIERVAARLVANPGLGIPTGSDRRWFPFHGFPDSIGFLI